MDNIIDLAKDDDGVKNGNKRGSNDDRLINSSKSTLGRLVTRSL